MSQALRFAALCSAFGVLAACGRPSPPEATAPEPHTTPADDALLGQFLAERGEDVAACFREMALPPAVAGARTPGSATARPEMHVVVALDASASMAAPTLGTTKLVIAKRATADFLASLPARTSVGLLAFGHRGSAEPSGRAASCGAIDPVYAVARHDRDAVAAALRRFEARGWSPLAAALQTAGRMLPPDGSGVLQTIHVVSGGGDTCGGDAVAAARSVHGGGAGPVINVIGFGVSPAERADLQAVAAAGGGTFVDVDRDRPADLVGELRRIDEALLEQRKPGGTGPVASPGSERSVLAGQQLTSCVAARSFREQAQLRDWARERGLAPARVDALRARLEAYHAPFAARAAAVTAQEAAK